MKNLLRSFSVKISLKFMLLITANAFIISFFVVMLIHSLIRTNQSEMLKNACNSIIKELRKNDSDKNNLNDQNRFLTLFQDIPYYITYQIHNESTEELLATNDPFLPVLKSTGGKTKRLYEKNYFIDGDLNLIYYSATCSISQNPENLFTISTALNMDNDFTSRIITSLPKAIYRIAIPLLFVSFLISMFITKKTIAPVVAITKTARQMNIEKLDQVFAVRGTDDEIDQLSVVFNNLFRQLKNDIERERQFSNDVSHELNTPLTVIKGQTNLLLRWGKDNPQQLEKSLEAIKSETKSMETIISNLLQISRLENGRIKPEYSTVSIKELFQRIQDEFKNLSPDTEIILNSPDLKFNCDEEMLHQILTILVSNSIKFGTAPCRISISAEKFNGKIKIMESDNGPGISEQALPHIFERFFRADESHSRKISGSGLGLAIAKTLVSILGGTISAENNKETGITFSIII